MDIITPVLLDLFLIYRHFMYRYAVKGTSKVNVLKIVLVTMVASLITNLMSSSMVGQICAYIAVMPIMISIYEGRTVMRITDYLKSVLAFTAINLSAAALSIYAKNVGNDNIAFSTFVSFSIVMRLLIYFLFRKDKYRNKIHYFEIAKYKDILMKFIFVFVFLIIMISLTFNEGIVGGKGSLGEIRALILLLLIVFLLRIYENIEEVVGKVIEKMVYYQQQDIKQNYLEAISKKTKELAKIRHDVKDHFFMVRYLVEREELEEVKEYLDKITFIKKELTLIPQKDWLNSLIYSKVITAEKNGIILEVRNEWEQDLDVKIDDMDMLSLFSNLINNSMEALQHVADASKKKCIVTLKEKKGYLLIDVFNYFEIECLKYANTRLQTTKKDKKMHGKGMEIIKDITLKYAGECEYKIREDQFFIETTLKNSYEKN